MPHWLWPGHPCPGCCFARCSGFVPGSVRLVGVCVLSFPLDLSAWVGRVRVGQSPFGSCLSDVARPAKKWGPPFFLAFGTGRGRPMSPFHGAIFHCLGPPNRATTAPCRAFTRHSPHVFCGSQTPCPLLFGPLGAVHSGPICRSKR